MSNLNVRTTSFLAIMLTQVFFGASVDQPYSDGGCEVSLLQVHKAEDASKPDLQDQNEGSDVLADQSREKINHIEGNEDGDEVGLVEQVSENEYEGDDADDEEADSSEDAGHSTSCKSTCKYRAELDTWSEICRWKSCRGCAACEAERNCPAKCKVLDKSGFQNYAECWNPECAECHHCSKCENHCSKNAEKWGWEGRCAKRACRSCEECSETWKADKSSCGTSCGVVAAWWRKKNTTVGKAWSITPWEYACSRGHFGEDCSGCSQCKKVCLELWCDERDPDYGEECHGVPYCLGCAEKKSCYGGYCHYSCHSAGRRRIV